MRGPSINPVCQACMVPSVTSPRSAAFKAASFPNEQHTQTKRNGKVRCDGVVPQAGIGCVIEDFRPILFLDQQDEYTSHVAMAIGSGLPDVLHRGDSATNKSNREVACKSVRNNRPVDAEGNVYECDEYPFAATKEGAASMRAKGGTGRTFWPCNINNFPQNATGPVGWSECLIPRKDNGGGGTQLSKFYAGQRVMIDEDFKIEFPLLNH